MVKSGSVGQLSNLVMNGASSDLFYLLGCGHLTGWLVHRLVQQTPYERGNRHPSALARCSNACERE